MFFALICTNEFAFAQNSPPPANVTSQQYVTTPRSPFSDPSAWSKILDSTEQAISRNGVRNADLNRLLGETDQVRTSALEQIKLLQTQVEQARQQLAELGARPKDGEPAEIGQVQKKREILNRNFAEIDARLKNARVAEVRAQQMQKSISDILNQRFVQSISVRSKGLTTAGFWSKFATGFGGFGRSLYLLVYDSFSVFAEKITTDFRSQIFLIIGLCLIALVFIRLRRLLADHSDNAAGMLGIERAGLMPSGFIRYLRNGILPAALIISVFWLFSSLELLTPRLGRLLNAVTAALAFAVAAVSLFKVYLSPGDTPQRLSRLREAAAGNVFRLLSIAMLIAVVLVALKQIAKIVVAPIEVSIGLSLASALLVGCAGLWILLISREDKLARATGEINVTPLPRTIRYLSFLVWPVVLVIIIAAVAGYVAFAEFLSEQLLFGAVVVLSVWLLLHFIDYVFLHIPARSISEASEDDTVTATMAGAGQAIILAAGLLKMVVYVAAAILLLLPWGYRTSDFFQFINDLFFGFEIGGLSISLSTIFLATGLFIVGYTITTTLRNWLNNKFLPTTSLDIGISNSISTVFGYAGFIFAAILAITAAGFDLSNLAIVAGALSVGVGFGLQSIVNNFVSGLILLAERPIKAGDWVVTSGGEGYVSKISVRSTKIETFDRATVIVPNSTLITDNVTNWTHGNKSGRIIVPVGVGYDSDPEQVREILLACASGHPFVLGRPAPVVYFMDFGASSLDFQLRCFLSDINNALSVQSELRFDILKALRAANIEIPYPQQDLHIRSNDAVLMETPTPKAGKTTRRRSK